MSYYSSIVASLDDLHVLMQSTTHSPNLNVAGYPPSKEPYTRLATISPPQENPGSWNEFPPPITNATDGENYLVTSPSSSIRVPAASQWYPPQVRQRQTTEGSRQPKVFKPGS
ncbi:Uu.00g006450.m01.CDS01 [Anthostomella pinea]|uniref:Uu.00g006450.m01.CDS01 n=1 Tax=Anthostomella pinea TaxID=933095 RepID=A0AAI8VKB4_9PEZI|nr:Uu.00g006450.m01.CDS01 [Anthostomella pinea]